MTQGRGYGIDERAFRFLIDVIEYIRTITWEPGVLKIIEQLIDAAGSIGANREEANGGGSKKELAYFNRIALRGARESTFWLRACEAARLGNQHQCRRLLGEAPQLARILAAIVIKTKADLDQAQP